MSSFFIVSSEDDPDGTLYEFCQLPGALEEFMHQVSEGEWAELRWSN